ncbi:MAG: ACT domain-containing protein [Methanomassiliicoccales archaeon]|nr:ACT domain-containing protein [Methanomassiliicoccales archaeon]
MSEFVIKQLSIFSENRYGRLFEIANALKEADINLFAFSIAEAEGFGVIRAIVDDPEKARDKLSSLGFMVSFTEVLAIEMRDVPGGLAEAVKILKEARINIEYAYAYSGREKAVLIIRVDNIEEAVEKIKESGANLVHNHHFT